MKWYTKQLRDLRNTKKSGDAPVAGNSSQPESMGKTNGHFFASSKAIVKKTGHTNPVAQRNQNRPKTDSM